jgi:glycosyltransferase involved in cell wall biosynthesis
MRILLVANYLPDAQQSMQRFAALLQRGLVAAGHEVRLVRPPIIARKFDWVPGGKWLGYFDKFVLFPPALKRLAAWADVVHVCDHANSSYVRLFKDKPHVVTCHDMLAIRSARGEITDQPTGWTGRRLQSMILSGLTRTQYIVCVSDATKGDVQRIANIDERRISRIYNGLNYAYSPMEQKEAETRIANLGVMPGRFILHVGGNQWYKNRLGVLRIFSILLKSAKGADARRQTVEELANSSGGTPIPAPVLHEFLKNPEAQNLKLIMVGKPWTGEMKDFARQEQLAGAVVELTGIDEEDLRALYSRAELMLFPSLQEGFGWPIAEAQSCGCPVVTTGRAPMTEVGGEAALYMDPADGNSAAQVVLDALQNKEDLGARGLRNASRFSTAKMVDAYAALYQRLVNSGVTDGIANIAGRQDNTVRVGDGASH